MYHVAPTHNRDAVANQGLKTQDSSTTHWGECEAEAYGSYLWKDKYVAQEYLESIMLDKADLYAVNIKGLDVIPDPTIKPGDEEYGTAWQESAFFTKQSRERPTRSCWVRY